VTAVEWLLWATSIWTAFLAFVLTDALTLCARLADRYRHGGQS
jgi:hypothetical protein